MGIFKSPKDSELKEVRSVGSKKKPAPAGKNPQAAKKKPLTISDAKRMYGQQDSFINMLPWYEAQMESNTILLDDGISVGVVFEATPLPTEGRPEEWLQEMRDKIADVIADVFDEDPQHPWVLQTYAYDDDNPDAYVRKLRQYVDKHAKGTQFTETWLNTMENHLRGICKEGGLFQDNAVTDGPWGGKVRHIKIVIYRRLSKKWKSIQDMTPEEEINNLAEKFQSSIREAGVSLRRCSGREFYQWMLTWFNPKPSMTNGDRYKFSKLASYPGEEELPWGDDFAESMFFELPKSNTDTKTWSFDGVLHQCIRINKLRRTPKIGAFTGEVSATGDRAYCMMDKLPPGSVIASTVIITPQEDVEAQVNRIAEKSKGESTDAVYARRDCEIAKELMAHKHKIYRTMMCVYIRGESPRELRTAYNDVRAQLLNAQLSPYDTLHDPIGLDAYILNLPMVYEKSMDKDYKMLRPAWNSHLASLSGLLGRSRGTENPGFIAFNRGGEMLGWDPLSSDRAKNGHKLILAPTGGGKSVYLCAQAAQQMAQHRPRLVMVEAGNSFGLLADYFKANGLTVNKVAIKPGSGISLAPFQDIHKLILAEEKGDTEFDASSVTEAEIKRCIPHIMLEEGIDVPYKELPKEQRDDIWERATLAAIAEANLDDEDEFDIADGDAQRDILGEGEQVLKLMLTGGEKQELDRLRRSDRRLMRDALLMGARRALNDGRESTRVSDVADAFEDMFHDKNRPAETRDKAYEHAQSLRMFCDGFEGEVFNQDAQPWPDVDVTILDLATFARDGYQAQLAIAYTSIMQNCNNLAERFQHSGRELVMMTDEAHLVTTNPLLSGFIVKIVKMWRKLGAWWWAATQNVGDFPNEAEKLLNMVEWWVCLVPPAEEIEQISRFRPISDAQKKLLSSASKEPRKYTEGVVLADNIEALFRNVPPSLYLALAGTEASEKAERAEIMKEFAITEVEAAEYIAAKIDHGRGIGTAPKAPISRRRKSA